MVTRKTTPCGRPRPSQRSHSLSVWQTRLRNYLTSQGLKYSEQRWKIAQLILTTAGHLDAQGLVEKVKARHPDIGAATVYRNLKVLCEAHILKESLTDPQGRVVYELFDDDHHDHIVCLDCQEIFEFHNEKIESIQNEVMEEMKFQPIQHRHVIYARCELVGRKA